VREAWYRGRSVPCCRSELRSKTTYASIYEAITYVREELSNVETLYYAYVAR
jgi:hypothetical protein